MCAATFFPWCIFRYALQARDLCDGLQRVSDQNAASGPRISSLTLSDILWSASGKVLTSYLHVCCGHHVTMTICFGIHWICFVFFHSEYSAMKAVMYSLSCIFKVELLLQQILSALCAVSKKKGKGSTPVW